MNYLITGGAGFIGSNYLNKYVKTYQNDYFICIDSLTYASDLRRLDAVLYKQNFRFIKGDIRDGKFIDSVFQTYPIDVVINFAAETHVDSSINQSHLFFETNVSGTLNLLEASRKFPIKHFHQVSTDEVYGDVPLDYHEHYFTEKHLLRPSSPYSSSKASADLLSLSYFRTFNLPITISRCSNNYGPNQFPEKFIPLCISNALNNQKIPIYGRGLNIRDWLFVDDHCHAIDMIIHKGKTGEIYNIAAHNEISNIDLVKYILNRLHKSENLIQFVSDRQGHDQKYAISSKKISRELKWTPQADFYESLNWTIDWYIQKINQKTIVLKEQR